MLKDVRFYIKLGVKKLMNMKIRTKITLFLIVITISTCFFIGGYCYQIAKESIIKNSEETVANLIKQVGVNLDQKIQSFQEVSYQICQTENIKKLLDYTGSEAVDNYKPYEGINTEIVRHSELYNYADYAFLQPENGMVYEYYKFRTAKIDQETRDNLLEYLNSMVTVTKPTAWVTFGDKVYFVRKILRFTEKDYEDKGLLCFAVSDKFFEFIEKDQAYLKNDNVILLNRSKEYMKNRQNVCSRDIIQKMISFQNSNFYTYTRSVQLEQEEYVSVVLQTRQEGWFIISLIPYTQLLKGIHDIYSAVLEVVLLVLLAALFVTAVISRTITKNIRIIEQGMINFEQGRFDVRIKPNSYDEIGLLAPQLNYMGQKISELIKLLEEEEKKKQKVELQALQAQINPHFLYNTLGSLKWAAYRKNETETAEAIDALIRLLRFTIKNAGEILEVQEEIAYVKDYVEIQKMRYGDKFLMVYELDEEIMQLAVPGFILQPFIENSLIHGLDMSKDEGRIILRGYLKNEFLVFEIEDNGRGMNAIQIKELMYYNTDAVPEYHGFNSIGVNIINQRLKNYYKEKYHMEIQSNLGEGTRITIYIPLGGEDEL